VLKKSYCNRKDTH